MGAAIRFGVIRHLSLPWAELVESAQRYEAEGFDNLWVIDHFRRPSAPEEPHFESWTSLAAIAMVTYRIRLGILVASNTFRHPALLAKEAVTLDHISNGRLEIGLGAGGFPVEHANFDIPYPSPSERIARLEETVRLLDAVMVQDITTIDGEFFRFVDAPFRPEPVQKPRPPITIGGNQPKMLRLAARCADRWNGIGTASELKSANATIDAECERIGRDPRTLIRSFYARPLSVGLDPWANTSVFDEVIREYRAAGIEEFIFEPPESASDWRTWTTVRDEQSQAI